MARPALATALAGALLSGLLASGTQASADTAAQRLDGLESRITRLEDLNQIERLQRTYGYFVDKAQWSQLAELFTDDATLEIGGKGLFTGKDRVLAYMQLSFGKDGAKEGVLINHMQFEPVPDISADGTEGWIRSRAFVMANGGWGLPLYENEYRKGTDGKWRISRLTGPFTMYAGWEDGWVKNATPNTWPDKFGPPPDLPPSIVYLTYPAYFVIPFHYPNPVTGRAFPPERGNVGAYAAPPGTELQRKYLATGQLADGTQPIAEPPHD
ncbi:MAG: nuclear transport factor 2 family protein [Novosphingobium sp.]|nr:nuclear transport factor 2 family protein [Novosphingobium sp.]